jgi:2-polyprenyl-3-methyl-5-hydroxy-6-metoxy-1,4-benzoquinol methylase
MSASVADLYKLGVPHNKFSVPMPDGTYYPDYITTLDRRPVEFLRHFDRVRRKDWADCSFLDLGCSEGTTTLGLSQMGSTVYGVEGRADGIDRANVLKDIVSFKNTHYWVDNVVNESAFREVDGIFNAGILYHLEEPVPMMERCVRFARDFVYV